MRLLAIAGSLGALLLVGTACGSSTKPQAASSPASVTSATRTADASAANTKQVCADVKQLNTDYTGKLTTIFEQVKVLAVKGDEAAGQKLIDQMNALTHEWIAKVKEQGTKASNPALRSSVTDLATKLTVLESGDGSIQDMNNIVQQADTVLVTYCA